MSRQKSIQLEAVDERIARLADLNAEAKVAIRQFKSLRRSIAKDIRRAKDWASMATTRQNDVGRREANLQANVERIAGQVIKSFVRKELAVLQTKIDEMKRRQDAVHADIDAFQRYIALLKSRLEYMTQVDETELARQAELRLVSAGAGAIVEVEENEDAEDERDVRFLESEL